MFCKEHGLLVRLTTIFKKTHQQGKVLQNVNFMRRAHATKLIVFPKLLTDLQPRPDRTLMLTLKIKLNSPTCLRNILSISVVVTFVHPHRRTQMECSEKKKQKADG